MPESTERAKGGMISGPNNMDSVPVTLSGGGYRLTAAQVRRYGTKLLDKINEGPTLNSELGVGPTCELEACRICTGCYHGRHDQCADHVECPQYQMLRNCQCCNKEPE